MITIRTPAPEETGTVRRLWEECFEQPPETEWFFQNVYRSEQSLCLYAGEEMASSLQMIPYNINLRGNRVAVSTLTGVSTGGAFRYRGYAKELMAESLGDMAKRGLGFTFLYPFDHRFYERLGWATCSASLEYAVAAADMPEAMPEGFTVRMEAQPEIPALSRLYDSWAERRNCHCLRAEPDWRKRLGENEAVGGFVLLVCYQDELSAYALCEIENDEINAYEVVAESPQAVAALLSSLKPRGLPVRLIAPEDDRAYLISLHWMNSVKLQPHVMFRVVEVKLAFMQAAPACDGELTLEITGDSMRPENNGRYLVRASGGVATAERTQKSAQVSCGIAALARILTGYMDANEAVSAGLMAGEQQSIDLLAKMYPKQNNFLFEMY